MGPRTIRADRRARSFGRIRSGPEPFFFFPFDFVKRLIFLRNI
jgi:hypothetical protein